MTDHSKYNVEIFQTTEALNRAAAEFIISKASQAIAARGRFVISLSGGQTPQNLYSLLAEPFFCEQVHWKKTFIFWGDERCVPLDDERNNAFQARSILLDNVDIPLSNIHFIPTNLSPEEAARTYEKEIKDFFGEEPIRFDIMLLGLGENGHTASLFPHTKIIDEKAEGVRALYVEEEKVSARPGHSDGFRVTMTAPLINRSHHILFLVTGEKKAGILKNILTASYQPENYPAQLIKPGDGTIYWFLDRAAAALINGKNY